MSIAPRLCASLIATSLFACSGAFAVPADSALPGVSAASPRLAGSWSWTDPQQCSETYEYAADGSGRVSSGDERAEMAYIFDPPVPPATTPTSATRSI